MFEIGEIVFVPAAQGGLRVAKVEELDTKGKVARVFWHENSVKRRKEVKFEHIKQVAASISAQMRSLAEAQSREQAEALERESRARSTSSSLPPAVLPSAPPAPGPSIESSDEEFYPRDVDLD
jgi:hypothetical protein